MRSCFFFPDLKSNLAERNDFDGCFKPLSEVDRLSHPGDVVRELNVPEDGARRRGGDRRLESGAVV